MPYLNQVMLMGHLGKEAETRMTGSGTAVTKFGLATTERYKDKQTGDWKEKTTWHDVVAFKLHEKTAAQLTKGAGVLVIGKIDVNEYEKDGVKRKAFSIVANEVKLLNPQKSAPRSGGYEAEESDSVPF